MAGYIGNKSSVVSSGAERKFKFAITETTTTLSNLAYTRDLVHVFHNGVRLVDGTDYTATNGTSITLTNAAENGDEVVVISYASFQPSDTVSASLGGFFEGNVTINADLTVDTNTLFVDATNNRVGIGTSLPASALDVVGTVTADGLTNSGSSTLAGNIFFNSTSGAFRFGTNAGTEKMTLRLDGDDLKLENGAGFERVRFTNGGNIGIGTSSPSAKLEVSGNSGVASGGSTPIAIRIGATDQDAGAGTWNTAADFTQLQFYSNDASSPGGANVRYSVGSAMETSAGTSTALTFRSYSGGTATERMRIDSSGNLLVGTTTNAGKLTVSGKIRSLAGDIEVDTGQVTTNANANPLRLGVNGAEQLRIQSTGQVYARTTTAMPVPFAAPLFHINTGGYNGLGVFDIGNGFISYVTRPSANHSYFAGYFLNSSGTVVGSINVGQTATSYNTSSDYRLKENVVPLAGAADRLAQIPVHRFNFIADPDTTVDGFIAHEVQEIVPEAITGTKDEVDDEGNPVYQGIDQSKLVPLLTAALQEALADIATLKAEVAALKGEPT